MQQIDSQRTDKPLLIIVTGATASGKTDLAIKLARALGTEIVSADSRQIYRGIPICTAAPTPDQLAAVRHHFVGTLDLDQYYSAARFEEEALAVIDDIFSRCGGVAVMCGGAMMYVDAVIHGIDPLPTISAEVREKVRRLYDEHGLDGLLAMLQISDPQYYAEVDRANTKRVMHALEIIMQSGKTYSEQRTASSVHPQGRGTASSPPSPTQNHSSNSKHRPFEVLKMAIDMPRELLFDRINRRVDMMVEQGLEDEARAVYHLRHLNSLNTVGFKEMFAYLDGTMDRDTAIARMAKNTRVYAKKQLTWLRRPHTADRTVWLPADSAYTSACEVIATTRPTLASRLNSNVRVASV